MDTPLLVGNVPFLLGKTYYWHVRIYIPATSNDISREAILPRTVHAVTPALSKVMPDEDEEVLESVAMLAAADDSLRVLEALAAGGETIRPLRVVIAAEVKDSVLSAVEGIDELPTALRLNGEVAWANVDSIHIDDAAVAELVVKSIGGDEEAFEAVADEDLMWYDVEEREDLIDYFS